MVTMTTKVTMATMVTITTIVTIALTVWTTRTVTMATMAMTTTHNGHGNYIRYTSRFMFWLYLKVPASLRVPGTPPDVKYTSRSQVHVALHVLDIFEGTRNPPGPRYTPGSQVHPRVPGIPPISIYIPGLLVIIRSPPRLQRSPRKSTGPKDFHFGPWAGGLGPERPRDPRGHRAGPGALGPYLTVC